MTEDRNPRRVPSKTRNPIIADVFDRMKYMERRGSGFKKILDDYEAQDKYEEKYKKQMRQQKKGKKMKKTTLTHHPMTENEKYIICDWKYADEYAIYNNTPYEEDLEKKRGFAHPDFTGYTFYDGEQLIGFTSLSPEKNAVMVGIGVAPEHCDKGYGQAMLQTTCALSEQLFPGKPLYLEVRTWNARAIHCYNKTGFEIDGETFIQTTGLGEGEFYRMVKK